jgi:hypothetical protein
MAKWWLISWTTYATWLPGDERGYRTWRGKKYIPPPKRYANPGEAIYVPSAYAAVYELAKATSDEAVYLTRAEMKTALTAIVEEIADTPVVPAIMSIGNWHVHWLCHFGTLKIRPTVGRVKAAATRELNAAGFQGKRPWTRVAIACRNRRGASVALHTNTSAIIGIRGV